MSNHIELTISKITPMANGVKAFIFKELGWLKYKPGQYLTLIRPTQTGEIRRSYSIFSSPELNEPLSIAVKRVENGMLSRYLLDEAKVGDKLLSSGTGGVFTLPEDLGHYKQVFFFSAGTGITPGLSMIKSILSKNLQLRVVLIYSNHSPSTAIFLDEIKALENKFPEQFVVEYLFSDTQNLYRARLHQDLLRELVMKHKVGPLDLSLCYLCGPLSYMRMCTYNLVQIGIPLTQIRKEIFIMPSVLPKQDPPDTSPYNVTIKYMDRIQSFKVQYPEPIHKAAWKEGMLLPYSCESGQCGNCVAKCTKGEVWMSYNEVLTEKDLENGLVLTCVGYPVKGDVVLEID